MDTGIPIADATKQMKPGRELDLMVEDALGNCPLEMFCSGEIEFTDDGRWHCLKCGFSVDTLGDTNFVHAQRPRPFSTDWAAAGEAWGWLEKQPRPVDASIALSKSIDGKPAVLMIGLMESPRWVHIRYEIEGETYPHAIALAVAEAGHKARRGLPVDVNTKP